MTIYFTSSVSHGCTGDVDGQPYTVAERRISEAEDTAGQTEYVLYVRGLGEFTCTDEKALHAMFVYLTDVAENVKANSAE